MFTRFACAVSEWSGRPFTFSLALAIIVIWTVSGPFFDYSEVWQLYINTGTTIVTFLMVFLIQNTTNRDTKALHVKLDEIVRALPQADNSVRGIERKED